MKYQTLINSIQDNLKQYNYTEPCDSLLIEGSEGFVIATPRRNMGRYLCGVFILPEGCNTLAQAEELYGAIRKSFADKYARFPYWKELGTYLVLICSSELYESMLGKLPQFKDKTGLHMNVMLGTVLIDRENYQSSAESTWGLYCSGKHFGAISASANDWCKIMRSEQAASCNPLPAAVLAASTVV